MKKTISGIASLCFAATFAGASAPVASLTGAEGAKDFEYSPMIFGQFIEHFDTQVYGGIFQPGSPLSDEDGFRKDVIKALKEIKVPIVRWPGGCFVSAYHWKYGIGPNRQAVWDKAWNVEEPNTFGTDEYVKWCRKVGCEPYICTNAGTGSPEEMSDWVEYCNLTQGVWGSMRAKNGYPKPHGVKYWSVGNENWGGHEIGAKTVAEWGPFVRESAKLMRGVDKSIVLFAAATPNRAWTLPLLKAAGYLLDYVSIHSYYIGENFADPDDYMNCMMRTTRPDRDIRRTIDILNEAGFGGGKVAIAFDEWNLRYWYHPGLGNFKRDAKVDYPGRRRNDRAATYNMADAVFSACFLNTCLRHAQVVKMANFSPIVNTRGPIFVHPEGIVKRTTYHVFWMYANLLQPCVRPVNLACPDLVKDKSSVPVLDAVLTVSKDGLKRVLAIANKHPTDEVVVDVSALTGASTLAGTSLVGASTGDHNDIGHENRVVPQTRKFKVVSGKISLPPHSVSCIEL